MKNADVQLSETKSQIETANARLADFSAYLSAVQKLTALKEEIALKQADENSQTEKNACIQKQIDAIKREIAELEGCEIQREQAKSALNAAKDKLERLLLIDRECDSVLAKLVKWKESESVYAQKREDKLAAERVYSELEQRLSDDKAGFLAEKLVEGEPCPVCGSVHHPKPAQKSENAPSEESVKAAKAAFDSANEAMNDAMRNNAANKTAFETEQMHLMGNVASFADNCSFENVKERVQAAMDAQRMQIAECEKTVINADEACSRQIAKKSELDQKNLEMKDGTECLNALGYELSALNGKMAELNNQLDKFATKLSCIKDKLIIEEHVARLESEIESLKQVFDQFQADRIRKEKIESELPNKSAELDKGKAEFGELEKKVTAERATNEEKRRNLAEKVASAGIVASLESLNDEIQKTKNELDIRMNEVNGRIAANEKRIERRDVLNNVEIPHTNAALQESQKIIEQWNQKLASECSSYRTSFDHLLCDVSKMLGMQVDEQNLAFTLRCSNEKVQVKIENYNSSISREQKRMERKAEICNKIVPELKTGIDATDKAVNEDSANKAIAETKLHNYEKERDGLKKELDCENRNAAERMIDALKDQVKALKNAMDEAIGNFTKKRNEIAEMEGQEVSLNALVSKASVLDVECLTAGANQLNADKSACNEVLETVSNRKNTNQLCLIELRKMNEKMGEISRKAAILETLNSVACGKAGIKIDLETWVQTIRFDQILDRANVRFYEMCDRQYLLKRSENKGGNGYMGLDINVKEMISDKERPASSLSGGESFMASLALALALSDEIQEAAGGIQLDSLFIDEGFGTLSDEARNKSINTLVSLQEKSNRMIGIISHVEELKQRIDNKIIVEKDKNGCSHIRFEMQDNSKRTIK